MDDNNIAELEAVNTETETSIIHIDEVINREFQIDYKNSQNIANNRLDKAAVINLAATFSPETLGKRKLIAILSYDEGEAVKTSTETEVIQVSLSIKLAKPSSLPDKFPFNSEQEVEFLVKNESELEATQIKLEIELLNEVTIVKEKPDSKEGYVAEKAITLQDFNQNEDNSLDATHQLRIKGKIKTDEKGNKTLSVLVNYDELKTLAQHDPDKAGKKFEKNLEIVEVPIKINVSKPLPNKIKLGQTTELGFTFTNESDQFSATNVRIEIKPTE